MKPKDFSRFFLMAIVTIVIMSSCPPPVVIPIFLQSISIKESDTSIMLGENKQFHIIPNPINTNDDYSVFWESSNPSVATISNTGVIIPISLGTTIITATSVLYSGIKTNRLIEIIDPEKVITVIMEDFPNNYNLPPCDITFSGTVTAGSKIDLVGSKITIYYKNRDTKAINQDIDVVNGFWSATFKVARSGAHVLVAKITTKNNEIAWSENKTLFIAPSTDFIYTDAGNLYKSVNFAAYEFDQYVGHGLVILNKNTIIKYNNGKMSYRPYPGGTWTEETIVKNGLKYFNAFEDILYGYFDDGSQCKKNLLVFDSPWVPIDSVKKNSFSSVACNGITAFGIVSNGEMWTRDLLVIDSPWIKRPDVVFEGNVLKNIIALNANDSGLLLYCEDTKRVYSGAIGVVSWNLSLIEDFSPLSSSEKVLATSVN